MPDLETLPSMDRPEQLDPDPKRLRTCNTNAPKRIFPPAYPAFRWNPGFDVCDPRLKEAWDQDGYVLIKGVLNQAELTRIGKAISDDTGPLSQAYGLDDGMGRKAKIVLWTNQPHDVLGMVSQVKKVAGTMTELLGGEVYHYHTKLLLKDAYTGGAHHWHQDYAYWSNNGNVFPDMASVFITLDEMDQENAGLQLIRGSHKLGLLPHLQEGPQFKADPERLAWALESGLEVVPLKMEPGDAVFFHCFTLHSSGQNNSNRRRWCMGIAYNRADNSSLFEHYHANYVPLVITPDEALCDESLPLNADKTCKLRGGFQDDVQQH